MRNEPIQKLMLVIGKDGCYFLSILRAAELATAKDIDALAVFLACQRKGWIEDDCYLNFPGDIYGYLVGGTWTARKEPKSYVPKPGEIVILRYEWKSDLNTVKNHFVLGNEARELAYDPMGSSLTVQNGQLADLRILARKV